MLILALCLAFAGTAMLGYSVLRTAHGHEAAPVRPTPTSVDVSAIPDLPRPPVRPAPERPEGRFLVAHVRPGATVVLRARPFGRIVRRLGARTEFGSPRALSIVRTFKGRWLAVTAPELGNGRLGWVDAADGAVRYAQNRIALEADLSRRELLVRVDGRVRRRVPVGIGRPESPTPTGRFAVTDKLRGADFSAAYGCCILALSGRQPNLPPGWQGGDRLAIHGAPGSPGLGQQVSAGCLRAATSDLALLMRWVPLGTPVVIKA